MQRLESDRPRGGYREPYGSVVLCTVHTPLYDRTVGSQRAGIQNRPARASPSRITQNHVR
jgi:hypothetical protein